MDELFFSQVLKFISTVAGVVGVLFGVDLIFGAKITRALKKTLDRGTDIIDRALFNHGRRVFGFIILILSLLILLLIRITP